MTEDAQDFGSNQPLVATQPTLQATPIVAASLSAGLPPAAWYPNPVGPGRRFWDGERWTENYDQSAPAASVSRASGAQSAQPSAHDRMSALGRTGAILTGAGGAVLMASFLLHQYAGQSYWAQTTRGPVILTLLAFVAVALAGATLLTIHPALVVAQLALGFYLLGEVFFVGSQSYAGLQIGYWLGVAAAIVMAVGASLSITALGARGRA
jgi:peptidoglycan/LPS O-acetylase OafA/YrhL